MHLQSDIAQTLDAMLVLGGENHQNRTRSDRARYLYQRVDAMRRPTPLQLVLSGSHSGLDPYLPPLPEAEQMRRYLAGAGVPVDDMHTETQALDTIGNMVFSRPILDQLASGSAKKRFGIVTDRYHISRSMWLARRVFPASYEIHPLPTERDSLMQRVIEAGAKWAIQYDLRCEGIQPGDKAAWEAYMREKHPIHADNAPFGLYKMFIEAATFIHQHVRLRA